VTRGQHKGPNYGEVANYGELEPEPD